jgi:hypothetical protein
MSALTVAAINGPSSPPTFTLSAPNTKPPINAPITPIIWFKHYTAAATVAIPHRAGINIRLERVSTRSRSGRRSDHRAWLAIFSQVFQLDRSCVHGRVRLCFRSGVGFFG